MGALISAIIWYYSIAGTLTNHIFTLREKTRKFPHRAYPFHQLGQFSQAFPGHHHPPQVLCFLREEIKRKRGRWFLSFLSKALFRSLLLLFFLSLASPHVWQSQNEWSLEDGWRRTVQFPATTAYNSRKITRCLTRTACWNAQKHQVSLQKIQTKPASEYSNKISKMLILLHSQIRLMAGFIWCFFPLPQTKLFLSSL